MQRDGERLGPPGGASEAVRRAEQVGAGADAGTDGAADRARLAEALRTSEEHLRAVLTASPAIVFTQDRELRYTWVHNPVPPLTAEQVLGKTDADIVPPEDAAVLTAIKRHALEHGVPQRRTVRVTVAGSTRHYDLSVIPRRGADGTVVAIDCATWDVTDRVHTEAALRESERRFRAMADSMPQLVWTASPTGVVDYYNARAAEYDGLEALPDGTWNWQLVLHPGDLAHTVATWERAVATSSEYACEHRVRMADGSFRWHLSRARLVRGQDGAEDKWFGTATDIHDRRVVEEDLQRSIVARDRVVSLVSHDLRNPLGVLRTSLALLHALPLPPAHTEPRQRGEGVLSRMERQIVKMERLLDELLDVAKLQIGQPLTLHRRPTDLVALAQELAHEHARAAPRHHVEVRSAEPSVLGEWDPDRLERVIGNLLSNAIKYSADGGVVVVEIDVVRPRMVDAVDDIEWAELRVIDGGVGIPEQDRHRVFEWFARGQNVEHTVRGTGLGLAGARQIVEAHGGTITVHSQEGTGSTFIVRLPVQPVQPVPSSAAARSPAATASVGGPALATSERERRTRLELAERSTDFIATADLAAALRESEARARALADNMSQLAWMADETGAVRWFNRRWYDYTGTTLEQMQDWGWRAVHHPDHVERVLVKFRRHIASGEPWEDTFPLRGRDGRYRWFLSRALPLRAEADGPVRWFGTNTDVTVQHEAEDALREADRRKDEFLGVLAHELRNPLAPIRTAMYILRTIESADPMLERTRGVIDRQVTHMSRLIDDLLDVSRISRGKLQLQREPCDLGSIARQTTEDHRATLETSGLRVSIVEPSEPIMVDGDPIRLSQMIGNLLHNAGRFSPAGGHVEVRTQLDPTTGLATVSVADNGVGIEPELLRHVFDPFCQADQGLARTKGGLGLGLALTKGIAELHGGSVQALSEGPGHGATFVVQLPRLGRR